MMGYLSCLSISSANRTSLVIAGLPMRQPAIESASSSFCCSAKKGSNSRDVGQASSRLPSKASGQRIERLQLCGASARRSGTSRATATSTSCRASGRADLPGVVPRGEARRHGGVLRRHLGLQHHLRRALCLDAAEAHPGLALRAFEAGASGERVAIGSGHLDLEHGVELADRAHLFKA